MTRKEWQPGTVRTFGFHPWIARLASPWKTVGALLTTNRPIDRQYSESFWSQQTELRGKKKAQCKRKKCVTSYLELHAAESACVYLESMLLRYGIRYERRETRFPPTCRAHACTFIVCRQEEGFNRSRASVGTSRAKRKISEAPIPGPLSWKALASA